MAPNHLAVYLSNRCNLACSYCYVSVNEGPAVHLSFEELKRSVDYFYDKVPSADKKITFLGGEPFLNFPLFTEIARYARDKGGSDVVLQTFTNGTLLTPQRLQFLNDCGVFTTISLDGKQSTNDQSRTFLKDPSKSVLAEVLKRLEGLPKDNLGVSLVFTSKTVGDLLSNIDFFYQMGFGRITFNPELYEIWSDDRIEVLRKTMQGFKRYYRMILEKNMRPFMIQILFSLLENGPKNKQGIKWWHDCHNVVLGPDQDFYACDKALTFPIGKAKDQRVGNAETGMDWDGRRKHYEQAIDFIETNGWGKDEYFCPMGVYFYSKEAKQDPVPMMRNFHEVADIFSGALAELISELESHPTFRELYVDTRVV